MKYEFNWKNYASCARQAAAEGCVLLRNDENALPIKKGERVSVFGRIQLHYYKSGTGSGGMVNTPYIVSVLDGLRACTDISLNEELAEIYQNWEIENPFDRGTGWAKEPWCQREMPLTRETVEQAAVKSDAAVVIIGRTAGEENDNSAVKGSYLLTDEEEQMLANVCGIFKRVAVVLNVGNIIDMKWVDTYRPQAVLYAWQGGTEGGNGIADVLTGKVNPCGKLTDTIALDITDYPSTVNFGNKEENVYEEDIYVGYRYFETAARESVRFPFGYGLTYTDFNLEKQSFEVQDNNISYSVRVSNTGKSAGKEVVQIYICPPQGKLGKPVRNLAAFCKTELLQPGQSQILKFYITEEQYASYDEEGKTGYPSSYVAEPGKYYVYAGTDVRNAAMIGVFDIREVKIIQQLSQAMAPGREFMRLRPGQPDGGTYKMEKESVPVHKIDMNRRKAEEVQNILTDIPYSGDKGYLLADVKNGEADMDTFLSQLMDEDLICLTRGEGMSSSKVTPGTAAAFGGVTDSLQANGIPAACCADGPSGIRMDCGTKAFSLPSGTGLACTFNVELVEKLYEMQGLELRKQQVDVLLGPGMNIHRNPLNGRNFEYFSEDPYLSGKMAAAQLRGLHKYGVTGALKHFACNNQEKNRNDVDSIVSERALREIYLKGFEIAVKESGAYCIMSTYGPVNGIWTAGNYDLLTTILRKEWGFNGLVMTDWWAKINEMGEEASVHNTAAMVAAQNDVYMVVADAAANSNKDNLRERQESGWLTRKELLRSAKNICEVVMRSPVMDRVMGSVDEWMVLNEPIMENDQVITKQSIKVDEKQTLDVENISTDKGSQVLYFLRIPQKGDYTVTFTVKSDAGELAQMPLTVFLNNTVAGIITMNGTGGEWIEKSISINIAAAIENYVKLYFGESGIIVKEIKIEREALTL